MGKALGLQLSYLFFALIVLAGRAQAAVWVHDPHRVWDAGWEKAYSNWVAKDVGTHFFKDMGKPFNSLRMDCADTHYALRAYFAKINRLPFAVANGTVTNLTTQFDDIPNEWSRLARFMDYLRGHFGTESLSHHDTFPPALNDLKPGDLFMWKIGSNGKYTRHTYIIKGINRDGTFNVLYSTQADAAAGNPLKYKENYTFKNSPTHGGVDARYWGFRRAKLPHHAHLPQNQQPGASFEQYTLAKSVSSFDFFMHVRKIYQTMALSPQQVLGSAFDALCSSVTERIDVVKKAIQRQNALGGACMNFTDYDTHSTPGRDSGIMTEYQTFDYYYTQFSKAGKLNQVNANLKKLSAILMNPNSSDADKVLLFQACPIVFGNGPNDWLDLGTFGDLLLAGSVSFHPNDNLQRRWGFAVGNKTKCKQHYGYPE